MKTWKTESFEMLFGYPAEVERAKREEWPVLIPVGTMEYHSHHCPFGCDSLVAMGLAERKNTESTIPLVEFDSILGFEPSMEYTTDRAGLEWKLRQVDYELQSVIPSLRREAKM